jgi:hypothetical protein
MLIYPSLHVIDIGGIPFITRTRRYLLLKIDVAGELQEFLCRLIYALVIIITVRCFYQVFRTSKLLEF